MSTADKTKKGAALKRTKNKGASNDGDDCKYGNFDTGVPTAQAVSAKLKGDKTKTQHSRGQRIKGRQMIVSLGLLATAPGQLLILLLR